MRPPPGREGQFGWGDFVVYLRSSMWPVAPAFSAGCRPAIAPNYRIPDPKQVDGVATSSYTGELGAAVGTIHDVCCELRSWNAQLAGNVGTDWVADLERYPDNQKPMLHQIGLCEFVCRGKVQLAQKVRVGRHAGCALQLRVRAVSVCRPSHLACPNTAP
jgi:hypothetical protein